MSHCCVFQALLDAKRQSHIKSAYNSKEQIDFTVFGEEYVQQQFYNN